ncbi:LuxR C-terminal-related transcriptional regulator [Draconibacterium halophilum]|uniref:Response regulator transcription factor n=1 Tax=Draconibacterium halophilum TaxID=2706887 RepID=A0A6C0RBN5_9BACT|nr:response regulator transcription factor [Draconibacterium halophilum]QIA08058.1 response regulator transcription factor [Draconibacterium halophilum]
MKILVAYDQKLVADCISSYLIHHKHIQIVGMVNNQNNTFITINELRPDLIILEFMLWSAKNFEYISKLKLQFPNVKLLVISELISHELMEMIMPLINGYVVKTCSAEKVIEAIHEIVNSGKYLCPKAVDKFFSCSKHDQSESTLTYREKQVLSTWVTEETHNGIANSLHISKSTVRTHLKNIREKLGIVNHLQMMIYACKYNLLGNQHKPICPNCRFSVSTS